jgi:hypothetical protein
MPSTTNLQGEEIVDAPGNDSNTSMPEQVKRPNSWKKVVMIQSSTQLTGDGYHHTVLKILSVMFYAIRTYKMDITVSVSCSGSRL